MCSERQPNTGYKKKLYAYRPVKGQLQAIEMHKTKERRQVRVVGSMSVEREFRQMLADKVNGTYVGLWLLVGEHVRLGTWDLVKAWCGTADDTAIAPRLALQMVHESALCVSGVRQRRTLRQKGFETLNGLPFVATDVAIHELLERHTMEEAYSLQAGLGMIRRARGHYGCKVILIDPHRIKTWTKRQFPPRKSKEGAEATKMVQTFFALDADSQQPYGFGMGSTSVTVTQATVRLVDVLSDIVVGDALVVCDTEHCTAELIETLAPHTRLSILIPVSRTKGLIETVAALEYTRLWSGYAVAESEYRVGKGRSVRLIVQRTGEKEQEYAYKPFVTSSCLAADELMTLIFPQRWDIEEFFRMESALGWDRASTLNMHIRYGRLSMALLAQSAIYELRKKLPDGIANWTAASLAQKFFGGIDGDIRVSGDTILVTMYNAPQADSMKRYYEHLPMKLQKEGFNPKIPWLYNFKVDFRFR